MTRRLPRALALAAGLALSGLLPAADRPPSDQLPADQGPWVVRAYFDAKSQLNRLVRRAAPWEVNHAEGYAVVEVDNRYEYQRLLGDGFRVAIDEALTDFLRNPAGGLEALPGYACYRTVEETQTTLADLAAAHPNLASVIDIGDSWEKQQDPTRGYDLAVLRLTNSAITGDKPKVFIIGAVHAREYTPAETLTRFGEWLLAEYADNADVRWLLDHQEVHLLPHGNPDGRKYAEAGQLWRKTVNQAYCGATSSNRGADINRNYPFEWGGHGGSSGDPCNAIYRGPAPASESETAAIIAYTRTLFPDVRPPDLLSPAPEDTPGLFVDVHSYGRLVMWPWGFTETPTGNGTALRTLGRRVAWFPGYTPQASIELYPTDGGSKDFAYGELGVAALSFELGDAFFEPCAGFESTIWPDNRRALEYLLRIARAPYRQPAGPSLETVLSAPVEPGETAQWVLTASDERFEQSNGAEAVQAIAGVRAWLDTPPWVAGAQPVAEGLAMDGAFDAPTELALVALSTEGFAEGRRSVYLVGRDSLADGPVHAAWLEVVAPGTTGRIAGIVRDAATGLPISVPALVTRAGSGTASNPAAGSAYALRSPAGSHALDVSASGYASRTITDVAVTLGADTPLDISLEPYCTLFADDASGGLGQFTSSSGWGVSSQRATSPPQSFTDSPSGNYGNGVNSSLSSVPLDLRDSADLRLSFQSWCDTETGYDYGRLEVSTDGVVWNQLWSCSGEAAWKAVEVPLPSLAGASQAQIRFRLTSDGSVTRDGWYVDDIVLSGTGALCRGSGDGLFDNGFE
jgi:hypothetical protein